MIISAAIDIEGLSKQYAGSPPALLDLTLGVGSGETVALIGENGAGKSTLIRILSTLLSPDSGRAAVAGFDLMRQAPEIRKVIGVALQDVSVYPAGRVHQVLRLHAQLHGLSREESSRRSDEVIDLFELGQVRNRRAHRLSGGMRRRLDLGLALIHRPPVLLLDEPTASLDPPSREGLWEELARLRGEGTCVLMATQDMSEAERLADRIVVLVNGATWLDGAPATAFHEMSTKVHHAV